MASYAGIGSRIIEPEMEQRMQLIGQIMGALRVTLRSGAAEGADKAFEAGCDLEYGPKEIFLPWRGFSNHPSPLWEVPDLAYKVAKQYYQFDWSKAKDTTKRFMARDCMQVTGINLDDFVDFVVCYTRDGCEHDDQRSGTTGGTGQAISYASLNDIPVFNLYHDDRWDELLDYIERSYVCNGI